MASGYLKYDTATNVINAAAIECGLTPVPTADPFASSDPNMQRICYLMQTAGIDLLRMYQWQHLITTFSMTTQLGDTGTYPLPTGFDSMIDQTGWQKSYFWPLRGPYSAQLWQRVVNYPTTGIYIAFRIQDDQLWLWPQPPPVGVSITFMYKNRAWVSQSGTGNGCDQLTTGADTINFDRQIAISYLKLRFKKAIGHDTTEAEKDFKMVYDAATSSETAASPELELARDARFPFITGFNSPDTGFGGQPPAGGSYQ